MEVWLHPKLLLPLAVLLGALLGVLSLATPAAAAPCRRSGGSAPVGPGTPPAARLSSAARCPSFWSGIDLLLVRVRVSLLALRALAPRMLMLTALRVPLAAAAARM
jgi:hypothetical protein